MRIWALDSLGFGILVKVFSMARVPGLDGLPQVSHQISAAITGAGVILLIALLIALVCIAPSERRGRARRQMRLNGLALEE